MKRTKTSNNTVAKSKVHRSREIEKRSDVVLKVNRNGFKTIDRMEVKPKESNYRNQNVLGCPKLVQMLNSDKELEAQRRQLASIFKDLYHYEKTSKELIGEISKLPNFNKLSTTRRKQNKEIKEEDLVNKKYPLSINEIHKRMSFEALTSLKQEQLLRTCHLYNFKLKNVEFEEQRFNLDGRMVEEDQIYPMDTMHFGEDDKVEDFSFIFEGLDEKDYRSIRDFKHGHMIEL